MQNNSSHEKQFAALISIISNSTLVVLKIIAGLLSGSIGIISEAIHSGIDLSASCIAYFSIRAASVPADQDHPYGHGKYEDFSGLAEAILIFIAAAIILYEAVKKLLGVEHVQITTELGIAVMLISTVANIFVSQYLYRVAKKTDSVALYADAKHLEADIWTSAGVLTSLIIIKITGIMLFDPLSALFIAMLIFTMAFKITKNSFNNLIDISLPPEEEEIIKNIIAKYSKEIISVHKFKTRKSGPIRFVDFHLMLDAELTIKQGHLLCDLLEEDIKKIYPESVVNIHIEACDEKCDSCHLLDSDIESCKKVRSDKDNQES